MAFTREEKPTLYSRKAIFVFSILLSTIFGALLFAENLRAIAKKKEIYKVILFSVIWNLFFMHLLDKIILNRLALFGVVNVFGGLILIFPFWDNFLHEVVEFNKRKVFGPIILFIVLVGGYSIFLLHKRGILI